MVVPEVTEHHRAVPQANTVPLRADTALHLRALLVVSSMAGPLLRDLAMVNPKAATVDNRAVMVDNREDMASSRAATVLPLPLLDTKHL